MRPFLKRQPFLFTYTPPQFLSLCFFDVSKVCFRGTVPLVATQTVVALHVTKI